MRAASIVNLVLSVAGLLVGLLAVCVWLFARPASRAARTCLVVLTAVYTAMSLYPVPRVVAHWLTRGLAPLTRAAVPPGRAVVVLLGSSGHAAVDWTGHQAMVLDPIGLSRALEAARVYHLIEPAWVVCSGDRPSPDAPDIPLSETMTRMLVQLGVPAARILGRDEAVDTHDEALMVRRLLPQLHVDHVVLVTSMLHMPRAAAVFRGAGLDVIPAPARDEAPRVLPWRTRLLPSMLGLQETTNVAHELIGLGYYWVRGWRR